MTDKTDNIIRVGVTHPKYYYTTYLQIAKQDKYEILKVVRKSMEGVRVPADEINAFMSDMIDHEIEDILPRIARQFRIVDESGKYKFAYKGVSIQ